MFLDARSGACCDGIFGGLLIRRILDCHEKLLWRKVMIIIGIFGDVSEKIIEWADWLEIIGDEIINVGMTTGVHVTNDCEIFMLKA